MQFLQLKTQPYFSKQLQIALLAFTIIGVLLNLLTPLRLNNDAIRYLNITEYLQGNFNAKSIAANDFLPHGYPRLLCLLNYAGLAKPLVITAINTASLLIASLLLIRLFKIKNKALYVALIFLSFVNIKHLTLPLADQVYTALFAASIYFWHKTFTTQRFNFIPALLFTSLSIYFRSGGIAIIAGVILYALYHTRSVWQIKFYWKLMLWGTMSLFIVIMILKLPLLENKVNYIKQLEIEQLYKNPKAAALRIASHLKETGETFINMPSSKFGISTTDGSLSWTDYLYIFIGLGGLIVVTIRIFKLKLYSNMAFWVLLMSLLMVFIWPYYDVRFLIPLIPFFILSLFPGLFTESKLNLFSKFHLTVYIALGIISLAFSDAISINRAFFLKHYGSDPYLTQQYISHFIHQKGPSGKQTQ